MRFLPCVSLLVLLLGGCGSIQDNKIANPFQETRKITGVDTLYTVPDSINVLRGQYHGLKAIKKPEFVPITAYRGGGTIWSVTHFLPFETMAGCKSFVHSWAKKFPAEAKTKAFCVQLAPGPPRTRAKTIPVI